MKIMEKTYITGQIVGMSSDVYILPFHQNVATVIGIVFQGYFRKAKFPIKGNRSFQVRVPLKKNLCNSILSGVIQNSFAEQVADMFALMTWGNRHLCQFV